MTETSIATTAGARATSLASANRGQYLTFTLRSETYAIGILNIKEIIEYGQVTEVPLVPNFIRGVINLRGAVLPVIDLALRFAKPANENTRRTCIVVLEVEASGMRHDVGIVVDAVNEVLEIPESDIEAAPAFGANISTEYIAGMGNVGGRFVVLLNVHKVLSVDELAAVVAAGRDTGAKS
jgi:purine-binding chemotaxis protein CheW